MTLCQYGSALHYCAVWIQIMRSEVMRISHELQAQKDKIKENTEKIKVNKTLPYLVSNVIEVRFLTIFGSLLL